MKAQSSASSQETQFKLLQSFDERCATLVGRFELLNWQLVDYSSNEKLLLGDCPVVTFDKDGVPRNLPIGEIYAAMLPISDQRMLFGRSGDQQFAMP
jgi:hypothetical protein